MTKKQREQHKAGNQLRSLFNPFDKIQTGRYTKPVQRAVKQALNPRHVQQLDTTPLSAAPESHSS